MNDDVVHPDVEIIEEVPEDDRTRFDGAVLVAVGPDEPAAVLTEGARMAAALGAPLLILTVDVTRFIAADPLAMALAADYDNPDRELARLADLSARRLSDFAGDWGVRLTTGDPSRAIGRVAKEIDARLIVVGTRKRGISEALRELAYGSVAARLSHHQRRPVLVVPQQRPTEPAR